MKNFIFQNPTRLLFGKDMVARLAEQIPADKRVMITLGNGSVKRNGVYQQVIEALSEHVTFEFGGIEPNPTIETVRRAIAFGREYMVDYLLAVGGGSVIDGTKLIATGMLYEGDPWELVIKRRKHPALPMGVVLTVPATGSEMNEGAVISCAETDEKYPYHNNYPDFAILDPTFAYTLSNHQLACGIVDAFSHVMEQYLTRTGESLLMDRWAEGILSTLIEIAPKVMDGDKEYDIMAQYMLCATMALNGFIVMGVSQDWAAHIIGHELTALCGVTHGESLSIVYPAVMRIMKQQKAEKLLQYANRVWGITGGTDDERIDKAIEQTEQFFAGLGVATRLSSLGIGVDTIDQIEKRFRERSLMLGENRNMSADTIRAVLSDCL